MKVYLAEEVRESIATRMLPLEAIEKDFDFAVDMMLHGACAFEIVQCKDCKHWYADADTGMACEFTNMGQPEDGYCNWGERKGGDDK